MHHFFVSPECLHEEVVRLAGPVAHQISRVLRMEPGAHIVLLDDSGWIYEMELDSVASDIVVAHIVATSQPRTELCVSLALYQALPKVRKFEWVLQKGTELGVTRFVPLITERCLWQGAEQVDERRIARWQRIVTEAAEQSGRARLPQIEPATSLSEVCQTSVPADTLALMAHVGEDTTLLGDILRSTDIRGSREIRLLVGPEGGFTPDEVEVARRAGIVPISLGSRILRTETVGLVAFSILLYALGELG